jgi:hypothetical protein
MAGGPLEDLSGATSRHVSVRIGRSAAEVYEYARQPANLPAWAAGLGGDVAQVGGQWIVDSPMGRVAVAFVPRNDFGVLDHTVTLPTGEAVYNPMRIIPDGDGCEAVFTVRRQRGMSDADFQRDADAVSADLRTLKQVLERR